MPGKEVAILRIGHRPERDQRVTTHVGLTARALGAKGMYLAASDKGVVESIADVAGRWGGEFFCEDNVKWRSCIKAVEGRGRGCCPPHHVRAQPAGCDRRYPAAR